MTKFANLLLCKSPISLCVCVAGVVIALLLTIVSSHFGENQCVPGPCNAGQYLDQTGNCETCPDGTFMPHSNHKCKNCKTCSRVKDNHRTELVTPCTKTADTQLQCVPGVFYKNLVTTHPEEAIECERCSSCGPDETEDEKCTPESDTKCSPKAFTTSQTTVEPESGDESFEGWMIPVGVVGVLVVVICIVVIYKIYNKCKKNNQAPIQVPTDEKDASQEDSSDNTAETSSL